MVAPDAFRRSARWLGLLTVLVGAITLLSRPSISAAWKRAPQSLDELSPDLVARQLSNAFAHAADAIRPSVVSIRVVQRSKQDQLRRRAPNRVPDSLLREFFGGGSPGGELFPAPDRGLRMEGQGSGFILDRKGHILTNNHVVSQADRLQVRLFDERTFPAKVIGTDPRSDLAVIKIDAKDLQPVQLGDSEALRVGQWVVAAGSPFGLASTITTGIVSAKGRSRMGITEYENFIQTDAAINPGNSGGPLVDLQGRVVGINTAIFSRTGFSMGIGFAIPIDMARPIFRSILEHGRVVRGWLGVYIQNLNPGLAQEFGYEGPGGVLVSDVPDGGPADLAGMHAEDILLSFDGEEVDDVDRLRLQVAATPPGRKVEVEIFRDGRPRMLDLILGELESEPLRRQQEPESGQTRGLTLRSLTPELALRKGLDRNTQGVLVTEVESYSSAWRAGIRSGNVIQAVGRKPVNDLREMRRLLELQGQDRGISLRLLTPEGRRFVFLEPDSY